MSSFMSKVAAAFRNDLAVTDEKAWNPSLWNLIGAQSHSGVNVDEQSALTYSAVFCAVNLIAGTVSCLPLHLILEKDRKKRKATEKKLYQVLHTRWNRYMTAQIGREVLTAHVLTWGNGYAEKVYNQMGELVELWPIPPNRVRPKMENGELIYEIRVGTEEIPMSRDKILHVPGLGFDGFMGYSVIALARESIGLSMAMEQFGANYFGNGTHPGVIVSHPNKLSEMAHKNLKDSLVSAYSGLGNTHRLMLLEEGMKIEKIGIPPNDSQFLESRNFQVPEIARWFNLPPHKLKDLTKSSFSNIEQEQISFVTDSILPWVIRFETNFNMQLLAERDQAQGYYFKHSVEGLLRGDAASRAAFYNPMLDRGVFSINEVREYEDKDPIEGGDIHLVPLNMTTLENAGKPITPEVVDSEKSSEAEERLMSMEVLKATADAYGVCVRAGAITPQMEDELFFREQSNFPDIVDAVKEAWDDDGGVRRPITLKYGDSVEGLEESAVPDEDDQDDPDKEKEDDEMV